MEIDDVVFKKIFKINVEFMSESGEVLRKNNVATIVEGDEATLRINVPDKVFKHLVVMK